MLRPLVSVRDATAQDAAALVSLWAELSGDSGLPGKVAEQPSEAGMRRRLAAVQDSRTARIVIAEIDDSGSARSVVTPDCTEVAGMMYVTVEPLTPLHETEAVRVAYLHVRKGFRRRGVGHQLLTEAATWAQSVDAEHVLIDVHPTDRESHRFLARVGLTQLHVQRMAPAAQLRRRLAADLPTEELSRSPILRSRLRSAVGDVRARRSSQRSRLPSAS